MEDLLNLYTEPPDNDHPIVCLDEKLVILHSDLRPNVPVAPGRAERVDYEYERVGTANLFVLVNPHAGWRHVTVTDQRTKIDYARQLQWLADECYPDADRIRLVQDNLNTHHLVSLYPAYPPEEACRLAQRFEVHYTPKHGSWLNMAEIEIAIVERTCLRRRVTDRAELQHRLWLLEHERNAACCQIHWRFTTPHARTKFARFYDKLLAQEEATDV
jgi:hypothetical protein